MSITGSCLCGTITFEVDEFTGPFELCHCNRCRKVSGSQTIAGIGCHTKDYRLLTGHGEISSYSAPIIHHPPAYQVFFCKQCGSPVPPEKPEGDFMEIAAGLLDEDPGLTPDKHIFVELLPDWDDISDDLPRYTLKELIKLRSS